MAVALTTPTFLLLLLLTLFTTSFSAIISTGSISPNFTGSHFMFIDNAGEFLRSINGTYTAAILNPQPTSQSFYLVVHHSASLTVVWSANRNHPISVSSELRLSVTGLTIHDDSGESIWSTPPTESTVKSLHLLDSGNLVLLDQFNKTLWQSFDHPTDTIVSGQRFPVGASLIASKNRSDYSQGDYRFMLTPGDGILQWRNHTYYRLSMDSKSIRISNRPVSYLMLNGSGFNLIRDPGSEIVIQTLLTSNSDYRILKISEEGYLIVMRYTNVGWVNEFTTPADICQAPFRCGKLGLCSTADESCTCPPGFRSDPVTTAGCSPSQSSLSLPESCDGNGTLWQPNSSENYVYVQLGNGVKYFSIDFTNPVQTGVNLSTCQDICSANCSCLAFFHGNQYGTCYVIENHLGSIISIYNNEVNHELGFIKAVCSPYPGQK